MQRNVTAKLNMYRQSPRKVRLVADAIRGKATGEAFSVLVFLNKRASEPIKKLLNSAVANAKNLGVNPDNLIIKKIAVDEGAILYRRRFRARGRTMPIRKRTSHISLVLSEQEKPKSGK